MLRTGAKARGASSAHQLSSCRRERRAACHPRQWSRKLPQVVLSEMEKNVNFVLPSLERWETEVKEGKVRQLRRTEYDETDWRRHRSIGRYGRHVLAIPSSMVVRGLLGPCAFNMGVTAIACSMSQVADSLDLSNSLPFELTAAPLGLMLVFRTNSSYARWVRAHDAWGEVRARTLELASLQFTISEPNLRAQLMRYLVAHAYALKARFQVDTALEFEANLVSRLRADELKLLLEATNRPAHTLQVMSSVVQHASLSPAVRGQFLGCIGKLASAAQACEHLSKYPIPLSYTRHTSRFLMLWTTFLCFPLAHQLEYTAIPAMFFISMMLFGVEEIGVQIEEPLSLIDLDTMIQDMSRDVDEAANAHQAVSGIIESVSSSYEAT
ncbi:hypothetical protein CYMTET_37552 [Cymbomonas tetramitiformis]|uniref:Uncharacterized protein n=1 Tax=Cymbomonas tetramitiformis TaxID=36881 RepID=A0AAE0CFB5_9CHLO|nr:hypothetical protein CYMTET_37552 [Cymbomonas tetramitiformis]